MEDIFLNGGHTNKEDASGDGRRDTMAGQISWVTQLKVITLPTRHSKIKCVFQDNLSFCTDIFVAVYLIVVKTGAPYVVM